MELTLTIGLAGMVLILFAFIMIEFRKWHAEMLVYDAFNFAGGGLLVLYAYFIKSWPFLFLNLVWMIVAFRDVIIDLKRERKKHRAHIGHKRKR